MKEMVGGCCVCSDERGWTENPLVYCDGPGCTVAVHQACYGIVTVPTGPWFCRKCESQERAVRVRCELCPIKDGALKRTDNQAWAHVVCALYIPEVRFGNVTTMEPIILQLVPAERFNKTCYICEEQGKGSRAVQGACMNCNKPGCKQQFHVTCAQGLGLLCEEAGNYMDNVKYCGYCQHHYSKLKKGGNVKQVPPYKPVPNDSPEEREESGRKRKSQGGKGRGRNATPSPNLNKQGGASPSPGSESGDHSRASTPAGSNGAATKELLPPPSGSGSVIKESKEKDKKDDKGKDAEKDKDKKDGKDVASSSISSTASTTSAKFTTSNFVETGPPNNVSSPGPVGSSVSSSANSIVVSVPLTAAVSLPNATSQQVSSAINTMTSGASSITSAASTTTVPADSHPPLITSSSSNSSSKSAASENLGKRSSSAISMKESPPSSPEPAPHRGRPKGRRGHSSSSSSTQNHKEDKEQKVFQNGVTSINAAPHMLGNQLNPSSSMAQKMSDTLTAELEAHAVFSSEPNLSNTTNLIGPQLPTKVLANVRASDNRSTPASGVIPQTLDQLLERQWEQGSQFLMEQAQHFDIASLLTCLHQLRSENTRLEEHIRKLQSRRDHLLAVNARLAIPLTHSQPPTPPHGTGTPGLSDGPGQSPGPLTPQGTPQGPSSGSGPVGAGGGVAQSSPQTPASAGHHSHPAATAGHPHLQHSQHSLAHPQSHLQGHQSVHSQGHSQGHPQGHPASHPASHPSSHSQGHPQSHSQGHSQAHSQAHSQGHSQGHPQSHSQSHSQGHPQSHSQGHPQSHSQGHPQSHSQGHAQSHSQGHSQSHSQGHTQAHSQGHSSGHPGHPHQGHSQGHPLGHGPGHPQGHSQGLPQGHPQALSQQSRQSSQRTPYGQPPLENGLPSESTSLHQGYGAHQRPQPSPNIRHTQSGSPYMMSQTPPASNPSVVRNSPVTSEQGRRGVGVPVPNPTQGYPMYPQGSAITMPVPVPPQQVVMHREADLLHASSSKHS